MDITTRHVMQSEFLELKNHTGAIALTVAEEAELFRWFMANRQRMVLKVACERCDEQAEYHAYCDRKVENG